MAVKIGLSGGIGSGKSTVCQLFRNLGVDTYDADQISRQLTEPETPQYQEIIQIFGRQILAQSAKIDRQKLAEIVFSNDEKRRQLENILHPPIREQLFQQADYCDSNYCILEVPLLFESGMYQYMQRTITVNCDQETRIQRLIKNRDKDRKHLEKIIQTQLSDSQRSALADDTIDNTVTRHELEQAVIELHTQYQLLLPSN